MGKEYGRGLMAQAGEAGERQQRLVLQVGVGQNHGAESLRGCQAPRLLYLVASSKIDLLRVGVAMGEEAVRGGRSTL